RHATAVHRPPVLSPLSRRRVLARSPAVLRAVPEPAAAAGALRHRVPALVSRFAAGHRRRRPRAPAALVAQAVTGGAAARRAPAVDAAAAARGNATGRSAAAAAVVGLSRDAGTAAARHRGAGGTGGSPE